MKYEYNRSILFYLTIIGILYVSCNTNKLDECEKLVSIYEKKLTGAKTLDDSLGVMNAFISSNFANKYCVEANVFLGDFYTNVKEFEKAKLYCLMTVKADSTIVLPLYDLGSIYYDQNNFDSAAYFFGRALKLKEVNGFIMDLNKKGPGKDVRQSKYDVASNEIIYMLGLTFYYKRDLGSALNNFDYLISNDFYLKEALIYRGAIYWEKKKNEKACADFKRADSLGNKNAQSYMDKCCKK